MADVRQGETGHQGQQKRAPHSAPINVSATSASVGSADACPVTVTTSPATREMAKAHENVTAPPVDIDTVATLVPFCLTVRVAVDVGFTPALA